MEAIENIEETVKNTFPDYDFYRSFTSSMIIEKIFRMKNEKIKTPVEVFQTLYEEGYKEVLCQPTHILKGREYNKICDVVANHKENFQKISVGAPLLATEEDIRNCAKAVMENMPNLEKTEAIVFMGHGVKKQNTNIIYLKVEEALRSMGRGTICLGTMEETIGFSYVLSSLKKKQIKKVYLVPFMIAAGEHVRRELAGEKTTSWKSMLEAAGYEVEVKRKGIGEYDKVAKIFAQHAKEASI